LQEAPEQFESIEGDGGAVDAILEQPSEWGEVLMENAKSPERI